MNLPPDAEIAREWEIDLVPLPTAFDNDAAARAAAIMVVAPPFVLACEVVNQPSAEPDELAHVLAEWVLTTAEKSGVTPEHVSVRHRSLVEPLGKVLVPNGIRVKLDAELPGVADAVHSLFTHLLGKSVPMHKARSHPETWAGWGIPANLVEHMFRAAAAFHIARPWTITINEVPIRVSRPGGHEWTAVILGAAGIQVGLALYHDPLDLERMHENHDDGPEAAYAGLRGEIVGIHFNQRAELPKKMRAEIQAAGWEVAGADAYPTLMVLNTPGGGIRKEHVNDVIAALETLPRFVAAHARLLGGEVLNDDDVDWTDTINGVRCRIDMAPLIDEAFMEESMLIELLPSGAEGPGATPLASLSERDAPLSVETTLSHFESWLRRRRQGKTLSDSTVRKHVKSARDFVETCAYVERKPIGAVNEYDLRTFLYMWYPRMIADTGRAAKSILATLRQFFQFLAESEGISCPWAAPILEDTETLVARCSSCPRTDIFDKRMQAWRDEYIEVLGILLLVPFAGMQGGIEWSEQMGDVEHALSREAHRIWLVSRDEALRSGMIDDNDVIEYIVARQETWANTPNALSDGVAPKVALAGGKRAGGS